MKPDPDPGAQGGVPGTTGSPSTDGSSVPTQTVKSSGELGPPLTTLVTITLAVPGSGVESHTSPIPSPSESFWSGFVTVGQLSLALDTPSLS